MSNVILVGGLDVAELAFYMFALFFAGLIVYLRREDRREGYPREEDLTGQLLPAGGMFSAAEPKTFKLPFDRGIVTMPDDSRDAMPTNITHRDFPGTPFDPVGDPLSSGLGPGAYAQRADRPDVDMFNRPRIVPMRVEGHISVVAQDTDPRGLPVTGCDEVVAGTVRELWVDRAEHVIRYIEVALKDGGTAMLPMPMAKVTKRFVNTDAITAAQFSGCPALASMDQITLLEEEKVSAYFGAGYLWATPARSEPLI
ncbi:MAG: photosynthetic reaction center subunit H [Sandarakinorhabdus sp.]|nr:photosynthetic reaction center subunit H [Sandarakinorhabdus sp.]